MDYELAKALKDAGFPQIGRGTRVPPPDMIVAHRDDFAYVPTLEQLIEACGEEFLSLTQRDNADWSSESVEYRTLNAATPIEAVARLWLALNKR